MQALGKELLLELHGCPADRLDDAALIRELLVTAVEESGATLIETVVHKFAPHGVTAVAVIAESHFSLHTWPEFGYAAADLFTCGEVIDLDHAVEVIRQRLGAMSVQRIALSRGMLDLPPAALRHKPAAPAMSVAPPSSPSAASASAAMPGTPPGQPAHQATPPQPPSSAPRPGTTQPHS